MPFTLTVDLPNLGTQEIYIHGLGTFGNGTHAISDEQAEQFSMLNSKTEYSAPDKNGDMKLVPVPGPSLEEAVASMYGVTIESDAQKPQAAREAPAKQAAVPSGTEGE